ncbi:unnamed protein product, partial [Phaeothamnion confervicola]
STLFTARLRGSIEYVSIKRVRKSNASPSFAVELRLMRQLSFPNIVKLLAAHETQNSIWIVMEPCAGGDLAAVLQQDGFEPEHAVRGFGVDLMAGLQHLHSAGVLHCDLRPCNVLLDEHGTLKLSGFGLAR